MYKDNKISVVVTAYNEEKLISKTINAVPDFVDKIIVIDDASKDNTSGIVNEEMKSNEKLLLLNKEKNQRVGGGIANAYKW